MKPLLLFNRPVNILNRKVPVDDELIQDLNLNIVFKAMAQNNDFIFNTVREVIFSGFPNKEAVIYRQEVLKDFLKHQAVLTDIYKTSTEVLKAAALYKEYTQPNYARIIPVSVRVIKSAGLMEILVSSLSRLKAICSLLDTSTLSQGLNSFCGMLNDLLTDEFFIDVERHTESLKSISEGGKIIMGAGIGHGIKGSNYILREISSVAAQKAKKAARSEAEGIIPLNNSNFANSAKEIEEAGLIHVLRVINHFISNTIGFFEALRYESGFYTGCINLFNNLKSIGVDVTFPEIDTPGKSDISFKGLYDISLCLESGSKPVENSLLSDNKCLFIITGANQGGKSTYLRSIGLAQLLMQCGIFVPASSYSSGIFDKIYTHFTREEDTRMNSGKLEEELIRLNNIINRITPDSILLMNEPFATTTERDASIIALNITKALYEIDIKVFLVTHIYEFSNYLYTGGFNKAMFLRAERNENGARSYKISPGAPIPTSFGGDLYDSIIDNN